MTRPIALVLLAVATLACRDGSDRIVDPVPAPVFDLLHPARSATQLPELLISPLDGAPTEFLLPRFTYADEPSASDDGRVVAYVGRDAEGRRQIYVVQRGGAVRQITSGEDAGRHPAVSPDGSLVAYSSLEAGTLDDIWVVRADGGGARNLTPKPVGSAIADRWPAWSPDGSRIAFASSRAGSFDIWTMKADGTDARQVTTGADAEIEPAWSPDGTMLVYRHATDEPESDLRIVRLDGTLVRAIALPGLQARPAWAPASAIAFVGDDELGEDTEIYSILPFGNLVARRTANNMNDSRPVWLRRR